MGNIGEFDKEKLIIGILYREKEALDACLASLDGEFGPRDYTGEPIDFTFTDYYNNELGTPITRLFVAYERLVMPDTLASIKSATNNLEDRAARDGRRLFNLDPGLLSLSRLILASTKPSSHRVALGHGIYAEIELMFEYGSFRPVEWTYADYRSPAYLALFRDIREVYRKNLATVPPRL
jgi:hypothetical protein